MAGSWLVFSAPGLTDERLNAVALSLERFAYLGIVGAGWVSSVSSKICAMKCTSFH
jgi:hypothetical protein